VDRNLTSQPFPRPRSILHVLSFSQLHTYGNGACSLAASMVSQPSASTIIAISVLLLAFAVITLLLRLISRVHFAKIFGAEDAFIILALVRAKQTLRSLFASHVTVVGLAQRLIVAMMFKAMSACHVTAVIYREFPKTSVFAYRVVSVMWLIEWLDLIQRCDTDSALISRTDDPRTRWSLT
jgi:hypothetical protein